MSGPRERRERTWKHETTQARAKRSLVFLKLLGVFDEDEYWRVRDRVYHDEFPENLEGRWPMVATRAARELGEE